ncbi:conserved hypothetical protein [Vibrio crassostreae]|uniref:Uncharacterized protein n=4 Tax=Vibrio TaxID=662 RepID=A0A4R3PBW8_9VIBR|nr:MULTISPECIES: hypothetical protein [Vibrio]APB62127.1 hypothetical protein [Vibrio crassostreae]MDH5924362.1 hypothetical protein [Vibrio splendidus]MDH5953237.1 hypothetical protein [Vibrio crassostreae]ROO50401.1 hypothetical protein EDB58_112126 [Vibrio crassostreae]TCL15524.1 hypothetical protein EDB52_1327 [Vibrio crassostreae]
MRYLFLHKENEYLLLSNENGTLKEEASQLTQQGFTCFLHSPIEAKEKETAKTLYLKELLFCATNGHIIAIHQLTGQEVWRNQPQGKEYQALGTTTLLLEKGMLICGSNGCVFALCPFSGSLLWDNSLPNLGFGTVTLATTQQNTTIETIVITQTNTTHGHHTSHSISPSIIEDNNL